MHAYLTPPAGSPRKGSAYTYHSGNYSSMDTVGTGGITALWTGQIDDANVGSGQGKVHIETYLVNILHRSTLTVYRSHVRSH